MEQKSESNIVTPTFDDKESKARHELEGRLESKIYDQSNKIRSQVNELETKTREGFSDTDKCFKQYHDNMTQAHNEIQNTFMNMHMRLSAIEEIMLNENLNDYREKLMGHALTKDDFKKVIEEYVIPDMQTAMKAHQEQMMAAAKQEERSNIVLTEDFGKKED